MVVRTAVVGAGTIARTHLAGVSENPRTGLVAVCDLDRERAEAMGSEFDTDAETDLSVVLADVDAIHVCTPVQTHFEIASRAIKAGVAVLIEKPATLDSGEIEELQRQAESAGVPATVVHNHLFDPALRRLRERIDDGELGRIRGVDVIYGGLTPPDTENRGSWVFELPGGEFEEGLPHPIYAALGLGGYPEDESSIDARTALSREYDGGFSYDRARIQYVSEAGALCSVTMLSGGLPLRLHVVSGTERAVVVDELNQSVSTVEEDYTRSTLARSKRGLDVSMAQLSSSVSNARLVAAERAGGWEAAARATSHFALFDRFARAVTGDGEVPIPLEQSKWTIRALEAIRESAAPDGRIVTNSPGADEVTGERTEPS
ncbi:Gfo/Idh/MocA family protein [Saliphagus infecundisoli]|uniref:Gfo/Idh/MocA family protein n=1 Tax=Saliphagus infecundisoli TaxID=1849069 RepID=A0ABD5QJ61_9EURY|nr:Gfo/Idh/MocA family oxidoreductase [Saliphagus infecundisoli]